ncbi:flagellar hook-length control protein FliK [Aliiroseovarius sp. Z3]|uniref:flagellar hook-length control protein FliK n=1 Tax=Aliiroseovarius sp. Z3 TaxID=2811402 RepID=UPI0023B2E84A|nr:flagellar hook-length control protein FliK [Aliiroseovarius sp. Z3]MDE9450087.1 flagellar hook-length control protein FliK [Aliiroseovarius sp. Z3]
MTPAAQTTLTPPVTANPEIRDPAPTPLVHASTGLPEPKAVTATPNVTMDGRLRSAPHAQVLDDPAQPTGSEQRSLDGSTNGGAKTSHPQSTPMLSLTATPASVGSPNPTIAAVHPVDDTFTTAETFVASDEPLPEMTAPHFRDVGQSAPTVRAPPELPRLIAAQLADVVRSNPDKPVELTLNPEELGRVRMSFQTEAASLNVFVQVERPETLDLMRRHIEQLAQDMHELGYDEVSFSFQQQQQDAASNGQSLPAPQQQNPRADTSDPHLGQDVVQIQVGNTTGIDIRI